MREDRRIVPFHSVFYLLEEAQEIEKFKPLFEFKWKALFSIYFLEFPLPHIPFAIFSESLVQQDWLYTPDIEFSARYTLGKLTQKPLFCIGVNPSTATPEKLDPTVRSVENHAFRKWFSSWIMLNVYPQRATNPDDMDIELNTGIHTKNLVEIEALFAKTPGASIWCAWGTLINKRPYLRTCLQDIYFLGKKYNMKWVCIGKTSQSGHPHHPLYLAHSAEMREFNIEEYLIQI
jgi:hypothetical protein